MKRKVISLMAVVLMAAGSAFGQIIITDDDVNHNRAEQNTSNIGVMVLSEGVNYTSGSTLPSTEGCCFWQDSAPPTSWASAGRNDTYVMSFGNGFAWTAKPFLFKVRG